MLCTAIGAPSPMVIEPMRTLRVGLRMIWGMEANAEVGMWIAEVIIELEDAEVTE